MPYILTYTRSTGELYDDRNYPGHVAKNCDVDHAMHMAYSDDGESFRPLRNNTGILFPRCTFTEGNPAGTTKTLLYPWVFRTKDGGFGVVGVRRNQNAPDPLSLGQIMIFYSDDLVRYSEAGFLRVADKDDAEIKNPRCRYIPERGGYYVEWTAGDRNYSGFTDSFHVLREARQIDRPELDGACGDYQIDGAVYGNIIEITDAEAKHVLMYFDDIHNVGVSVPEFAATAGVKPCFDTLPDAICEYNDGSTHNKKVMWDRAAFDNIDFSVPGEHILTGEVKQTVRPFPIELRPPKDFPAGRRHFGGMSDPCMLHYKGKYYLTSSGGNRIQMRVGDTLDGAFDAEPIVIYEVPVKEGERPSGTWAAELHEIAGVPYLLTSLCESGDWTRVKSCILRCNGKPEDPSAWEPLHLVVKPDGTLLRCDGISLDMTYFCDAGVHYVMWSDRKMDKSVTPYKIEPADIYIAIIDPAKPWQLVSEPQCVIRPIYGWDRYETEVDEGPYLLRHNDDLFVTISGSSTGMADLYCLGLLHAHSGDNLMSPDAWDWLPYPVLTKESVENEFGPGHNAFIKDEETGDDLMVYHAVPHDENGRGMGRRPGVRRVHWAASGYPYLEMTKERDLSPEYKQVKLRITVK